MARGKLFSKFKFLDKDGTKKIKREMIASGIVPVCEGWRQWAGKDANLKNAHRGKLLKYQTVDGKVILVCRKCKEELESLEFLLRDRNIIKTTMTTVLPPKGHPGKRSV